MNYEKKYEKLVDAVKVLRDNNPSDEGIQNWVNDNFPELKESEDEKVEKAIFGMVYDSDNELWSSYDVLKSDVLAWLEKQGEKKPTYKLEPRFNVGDWITDGQLTCKVLSVTGKFYELHLSNDDYCHFETPAQSVDKHYHLWSIEDAKDGDILFQDLIGGKTFIYNGVNPEMAILYSFIINNDGEDVLPYHIGKPNIGIGNIEENKNIIHPATKEQRALLFQKMKEAGYEWDAEKKELKKIEQKSDDYCQKNCKGYQETGKCFADGDCKAKKDFEQKSTEWSEEDENIRKELLESFRYQQRESRTDKEWLNGIKLSEVVAWLEKQNPENIKEALRMEYEKKERIGG